MIVIHTMADGADHHGKGKGKKTKKRIEMASVREVEQCKLKKRRKHLKKPKPLKCKLTSDVVKKRCSVRHTFFKKPMEINGVYAPVQFKRGMLKEIFTVGLGCAGQFVSDNMIHKTFKKGSKCAVPSAAMVGAMQEGLRQPEKLKLESTKRREDGHAAQELERGKSAVEDLSLIHI